MRKILLIAGLLAGAALPSLAQAQVPPGCVRHDNRTAGTVIGGVAGALVGSQVAGRGDRTAGAVIGGVGGAIVGNQLAGSSVRCPQGYYQQETQYAAPPPAAYDNRGSGYNRDDRGSGYGRDDRGGGFDRGTFWQGAPNGIREREEWLERRINRGINDGSINRREARRVITDLQQIRFDEQRLRRRNGGRLNERDRDILQDRLDGLAQQIRWARSDGPGRRN